MKIQKKQTIGENLLYLMVWSAIILVPVLNSFMMSELHVSFENVLMAWRKITPYLIIFLVHNFLLAPRFMLRRQYALYLLGNLALLAGIFWAVDFYEQHLAIFPFETLDALDPLEEEIARHKASFTDLDIYWNILLGFFMTGANTGIKLMYQSIRDEQKMEDLTRENLEAEMNYLKYQINPHFFMNTLNNIHALIDIDSESAKKAVIDLSKMMRYVLYESGRENISLNKDIQFLKNYIELMRIRYTDAVEITIHHPQNLSEQISIPPLLLIVFIENAFKHGISYSQSSYIDLKIDYADGLVTSIISNSNHGSHSDDFPAGIGLENVRKRLELLYEENDYTLEITENKTSYTVKLVIPTLNA